MGLCVISVLEKQNDIKTMVDSCTTDEDCKTIKDKKNLPYDKNYLNGSTKLCLNINSYNGGKYKNSKKSRKFIKKSRRKKRKKRKSRRYR